MQDPIEGMDEAADASADEGRRRLLKAGAVGVAAAGVLATGSPAVLGLGTAPDYAAGASPTDPTTPPPTTGSVVVRLNLMDGGTTAASPVNIPESGTGTAYLYSSADRNTTPAASVAVSLPAGQTYVEYTFTNVPIGNYYVDIQQPFDGYGVAGVTFAGNTYYVDWNFGHRPKPSWYEKIDEYLPVTVTGGGTANIAEVIQVALKTTPPPWAS